MAIQKTEPMRQPAAGLGVFFAQPRYVRFYEPE